MVFHLHPLTLLLVNDLVFLDGTLHKNLMALKKIEDVEDLSLNFTLVDSGISCRHLIQK